MAPEFLMKARLLLRSIPISSRFYNFFITDFVIFFLSATLLSPHCSLHLDLAQCLRVGPRPVQTHAFFAKLICRAGPMAKDTLIQN